MTADTTSIQPSASPISVGVAFLAYLKNGLCVPVLPVTVIANAANRSLPIVTCIVVLLAFEFVVVVPGLAGWFDFVSTGAASTGEMLADLGWEFGFGFLYRLLLLGMTYGFARLLGGQGTFARFLSAALVVESFLVIWVCVSVLASLAAAALIEDAVPTSWALLLGQVGLYLPVVVSVIAISYLVLVIRFGALLDYFRSALALIGTIAIVCLYYYSLPYVALPLLSLWNGRV